MIRIPKIIKRYYPELIWRIDSESHDLYLTFDDGPTPGVTDWVLDQLKQFNAKATFFCIGNNVRKNPILFERIIREDHRIGNHTYDHKKGWNTGNFDYMKSVVKCNDLVQSDIFRPPYGKIKKTQIKALSEKYRIIMWDVLSEDYNPSVNPETCVKKVIDQTKDGSIIVFHDSLKARKNLTLSLPVVLEYFTSRGYNFRRIS